MKKSTIAVFWILAIILTLSTSVYQRLTGPTNPKKTTISINNKEYKLSFPRSATSNNNKITLNIADSNVKAQLIYRKYPTNEDYSKIDFQNNGSSLFANLPIQPSAGKLEYYVIIDDEKLFETQPLIVRFKGEVPAGVLIPHIIFMFVSMLFAAYGLILAIANKKECPSLCYFNHNNINYWGIYLWPNGSKICFWSLLEWISFWLRPNRQQNPYSISCTIINMLFLKKKIFRITSIIAFSVMITIFLYPSFT